MTRECWKLCFVTFFSGTNYDRDLDSLRCTRIVGKIIELFENDKAEAFFSWRTFALLRCICPVTKQRRLTNCSTKQFIGECSLTAASQFTIFQCVFFLLGGKYDEDIFYLKFHGCCWDTPIAITCQYAGRFENCHKLLRCESRNSRN